MFVLLARQSGADPADAPRTSDLNLRRTRALIEDLETGKRWTTPLYMLDVEGGAQDLAPLRPGIDRLSLRIGDTVGFTDRNARERMGTVIKLNPKRTKVRTDDAVWTVPYGMLFPVIEGETGEGELLLAPR